jgi:predicted outer membrane repeat protein
VTGGDVPTGGGIRANASTTITLRRTTISGNLSPGGFGGGLFVGGNSTTTIVDSTFSGNTSTSYGGGIFTYGRVTIVGSTITGNTAGASGGGAILYASIAPNVATVVNSTITGNSANRAGGIDAYTGTVNLRNVTVTNNTATANGGGVRRSGGATLTIQNSIVANNTAPTGPDVFGQANGNAFNLIESTSGASGTIGTGSDITGQDPQLGALANNGGLTQTLRPSATSPAINAGNPAGCVNETGGTLTQDQRAVTRPQPAGGRCDIGAVELQTAALDLDAGQAGIDYATTFTPGSGPVPAVNSTTLSLVSMDAANLGGATITLTSRPDGAAEALAANTAGTSIAASYNPATGVLTLSGTDSVANYQQVLRTVTYANSAPIPTGSSRTITFVAGTGGLASPVATTTLTIQAVTPTPTSTPTATPTGTATPTITATATATATGTLPTATPSPIGTPTSTPTASPTVTSTATQTVTSTPTPTVTRAAAPLPAQARTDSSDQYTEGRRVADSRLSPQGRVQQDHTNRAGLDDYHSEGDVVGVRCSPGDSLPAALVGQSLPFDPDDPAPYIVVGTRDGLQQIRLLGDAAGACSSIRAGSYVQVEGVKHDEGLFDADDVTVSRPRAERVAPPPISVARPPDVERATSDKTNAGLLGALGRVLRGLFGDSG